MCQKFNISTLSHPVTLELFGDRKVVITDVKKDVVTSSISNNRVNFTLSFKDSSIHHITNGGLYKDLLSFFTNANEEECHSSSYLLIMEAAIYAASRGFKDERIEITVLNEDGCKNSNGTLLEKFKLVVPKEFSKDLYKALGIIESSDIDNPGLESLVIIFNKERSIYEIDLSFKNIETEEVYMKSEEIKKEKPEVKEPQAQETKTAPKTKPSSKRKRNMRYAGYAAGAAAIVGVGYLAYRHFSASDPAEIASDAVEIASAASEVGVDVLEASVNYF